MNMSNERGFINIYFGNCQQIWMRRKYMGYGNSENAIDTWMYGRHGATGKQEAEGRI